MKISFLSQDKIYKRTPSPWPPEEMCEPMPFWMGPLMLVASAISIILSLAALVGAVKLLLWTVAL